VATDAPLLREPPIPVLDLNRPEQVAHFIDAGFGGSTDRGENRKRPPAEAGGFLRANDAPLYCRQRFTAWPASMTDGLLLRGARGRTALHACVICFTAAGGGMPTPAKRTHTLIYHASH
jgi:hypothetical protein